MTLTLSLNDEHWEALTEELLIKHFQYGRQALHPAINCIVNDLQTVCEVYRSYPETCANLLEQAMMNFSKQEYEEQVLAATEANCEEEPALWPLVDSLRNLRKYIGDNPSELAKTFHREIALLPNENKTKLFCELINEICHDATKRTIMDIRKTANTSNLSLCL